MRFSIATLFLLLAPMAASAQALQEDTEQEPRSYTVEMIVFTYAEDIGSGGEVFVADPPAEAAAALPDNRFSRLRRSDFTMGDIRARLDRLDAYRPVMHFGWTQTTYPAEQTRSIRLSSLTTPAGGFDGTVKLYLSRFLHLVVDLQMNTEADRRQPLAIASRKIVSFAAASCAISITRNSVCSQRSAGSKRMTAQRRRTNGNYSATRLSRSSRNSRALRVSLAVCATSTVCDTVTNLPDSERG